MRTHLLVPALALSLVASGTAMAQAWQNFTSSPGRFAVQMPGTPKAENSAVDTAAGKLNVSTFTVAADGGATAFIVSFTDYPAGLVAKGDPTKILIGARDGQLSRLKGKVSSDRVISINGYPGRDVSFAGANNVSARCKMFLVRNRLYQVLALSQNTPAPTASFARFVDSFKLTK